VSKSIPLAHIYMTDLTLLAIQFKGDGVKLVFMCSEQQQQQQ